MSDEDMSDDELDDEEKRMRVVVEDWMVHQAYTLSLKSGTTGVAVGEEAMQLLLFVEIDHLRAAMGRLSRLLARMAEEIASSGTISELSARALVLMQFVSCDTCDAPSYLAQIAPPPELPPDLTPWFS